MKKEYTFRYKRKGRIHEAKYLAKSKEDAENQHKEFISFMRWMLSDEKKK